MYAFSKAIRPPFGTGKPHDFISRLTSLTTRLWSLLFLLLTANHHALRRAIRFVMLSLSFMVVIFSQVGGKNKESFFYCHLQVSQVLDEHVKLLYIQRLIKKRNVVRSLVESKNLHERTSIEKRLTVPLIILRNVVEGRVTVNPLCHILRHFVRPLDVVVHGGYILTDTGWRQYCFFYLSPLGFSPANRKVQVPFQSHAHSECKACTQPHRIHPSVPQASPRPACSLRRSVRRSPCRSCT